MTTVVAALLMMPILQTAEIPKLGNFARTLTVQDFEALEREALPADKRAWLYVGPSGQVGQSVEAYLPPETSTGELRRGTVRIVLRLQPGSPWYAFRDMGWAQVAVNGRNFDSIEGDEDLNRPFIVIGNFDDVELVSLVQFLRGSKDVERTWPVQTVVRRQDNSISVTLGPETGSLFEMVILKKQGTDWTVISAQTGRA